MTPEDLEALLALPLPVRARTLSRSLWVGLQTTRKRGPGGTFRELRPYDRGDPLNRIDWRASARLDRWMVREDDRLSHLKVALLIDRSPSMDTPDGPVSKRARAETLAAAIGLHAIRQGHSVTLLDGADFQPPAGGRTGRTRILDRLEAAPPTGRFTPPVDACAVHIDLVILVSDLLDPGSEVLLESLGDLTARGRDVRVLHLLDPLEREFGLRGPQSLDLIEADAAARLRLDASRIRNAYLNNLESFIVTTRRIARHADIPLRLSAEPAQLLTDAVFLASGERT